MLSQRSKRLRKSYIFLFCVVVLRSVNSEAGDATFSGPYPAAITPDSSYRGYGSDLVNRGYSITPAALAYHSGDPASVALSQLRDDDIHVVSPPLVREPQPPPSANLVRYIILKEYHVLQDGTLIPSASDTVIGRTDGSAQISPIGGYSSSASSGGSGGYSSPSSSGGSGGYSSSSGGSGGYSSPSGGSGGYSSPSSSGGSGGYSSSSSSGGSGGYSSSPGGGSRVVYSSPAISSGGSGSGYSSPAVTSVVSTSYTPSSSASGGSASSGGTGNQGLSARRPSASLNTPEIEITRVELPEDSEELPRNVPASNTGTTGSSGRNAAISQQNDSNNDSENDVNDEDDNGGDSGDDDNGNDSDYDDDGGEQDDDDEDDEENGTTGNSNSNRANSGSSSSNQQRNNNRPQQQSQRGNNDNRESSSGNSNANSQRTNTDSFQVTPVQGINLGNNQNSNRPQQQTSNTRGRNSSGVLTDAFMFSEPSSEATTSNAGTLGNSNRNSNSRRNNSTRGRNRNRNNRNRNRSRGRGRGNRRNRNNSTSTTTPSPSASSEELAPIVLPTSASPQLQEALALVAQFAQEQANLLSRTKQQAKNIAGSVFNRIPGLGFGSGGILNNSLAPYPESQSSVSASQVSITRLRETGSNSTNQTQSSSALPPPSTSDSPPSSSSTSFQSTYGAPSSFGFGNSGGFTITKLNNGANLHQQLLGLKSGIKAGILNTVQNTVAAVHSKGETGTSTTSPSPIYGPPPTSSFQIIKAVKGHFINKAQGVGSRIVSKGTRVVGHFTNKGTQFVGHFTNKGKTVKNHFLNKGARLTQKASTVVDAKHMHLQNVIKHIQTIFQHNPALTAW